MIAPQMLRIRPKDQPVSADHGYSNFVVVTRSKRVKSVIDGSNLDRMRVVYVPIHWAECPSEEPPVCRTV
jgi:hypothetical protein